MAPKVSMSRTLNHAASLTQKTVTRHLKNVRVKNGAGGIRRHGKPRPARAKRSKENWIWEIPIFTKADPWSQYHGNVIGGQSFFSVMSTAQPRTKSSGHPRMSGTSVCRKSPAHLGFFAFIIRSVQGKKASREIFSTCFLAYLLILFLLELGIIRNY